MIRSLLIVFAILSFSQLHAQNPIGLWKTIDDESSEAKSHVEIYEDDGKYFGKIVKLLADESTIVCDHCTGKKKDRPILGMVILEKLSPYKDYWSQGTILDPANGNQYRCSVWYDEGNKDELKVRGKHWTGLYRTQTWYRVK
ncbi:MAG: DUF2147 domain-containing protein [Saprospiraceae bacterium]|nr:DUF2147 domain-containing protein [Saprospiraceae bacterium]